MKLNVEIGRQTEQPRTLADIDSNILCRVFNTNHLAWKDNYDQVINIDNLGHIYCSQLEPNQVSVNEVIGEIRVDVQWD